MNESKEVVTNQEAESSLQVQIQQRDAELEGVKNTLEALTDELGRSKTQVP